MRFLYITCICLFPLIGYSQEVLWSKNYGGSGGDRLYTIKPYENGYIIVGSTSSKDFDITNPLTIRSETDGWVLRIDQYGNVISSSNYGGSDSDFLYDFEILTDGFLFLGQTKSSDIHIPKNQGESDIWLLKTDFDGSIIWSKTFGSSNIDKALDLYKIDEERYIVSANTCADGERGDVPDSLGADDLWVFMINSNGDVIWNKVFGGSNGDMHYGFGRSYSSGKIHKNIYGEYLITGESFSDDNDLEQNYGNSDNWALTIDENGNKIRSRSFGEEGYERLTNFLILGGKDFFYGTSSSQTGLYANRGEAFFYSYGINDLNEWSISQIHNEFLPTNAILKDGHTPIFSGGLNYTSSGYGLHDGSVLKIDEQNDKIWLQNYGGSELDVLISVCVADSQNIIACGYTGSDDFDLSNNYSDGVVPTWDGWIIKIKDTCVTKKHEIDTFLCSNSYLLFQSDTIDQEGTYTDTFTAKTGCDSVIIWNVEVYGEDVDSIINASFCKSYTLPTGRVINQSGVYYDTLTSYLGCDSVIQYDLKKEFFLRDSFTIESCEIYLHQNGQVLESDGVINDTIYNTISCDSIYTYKIDIVDLDTMAIVLKKEEGQTIQYRDTAFTIPGQYIYRQKVASGCDSIYLIDVIDYKDCELYIPNAFTPNGDDINDRFSVSVDAACELFNFRALIFDRWGQTIVESRNPLFIWDGDGYPSGVYVYFITYEYEGINGIQSEGEYGTISIVR